jgi:hypothetical protein
MKTNSQLITLMMVSLCTAVFAQDAPMFKGPVVYLELGGPSSFLTANVEHVIWKLPRWYVNGRVGYGYAMINGYERSGIPIGINFFRFQGNHHLEISGGISYIEGIKRYSSAGENYWNRALYGYAAVGYRFQRPQGGMFFRAQWHPLFQIREFNPDPYFHYSEVSAYWWGLSVGYAFTSEKKGEEKR